MTNVSVIIPNYNHASYLKQRIESVLQQRYRDFELILLDDASTDNSKAIIEEYRHHPLVSHIFYNAENSGSTFKQWHKGIMLAKGQYIWLAESDDFANEAFLEVCMQVLEDDQERVLVYTDSFIVDENNTVLEPSLDSWYLGLDASKWAKSFSGPGRLEFIAGLADRNTIPNASAVVFKKTFFNEVLTFRYCGDWFFWIKMLESNPQIAFVKRSLNYFRSHENTTRGTPYTLRKLKQFIKERSMILFYLRQNGLIDPTAFITKRRQIVHEWKCVFVLTDIIKKDFYIPARNPVYLLQFIAYKLTNGVQRLKMIFK